MFGESKGETQADEKIQTLLESVKPKVESELKSTYNIFKALTFSSKMSIGTIYKIKVDIGDENVLQVSIFKPLAMNGTDLELREAKKVATIEEDNFDTDGGENMYGD